MFLAIGSDMRNGIDTYWTGDAKNAETIKTKIEKDGRYRVYRVMPMKVCTKTSLYKGEPEL